MKNRLFSVGYEYLLLVSSEPQYIIGWHDNGTAFQVRQLDIFVNEILPKHFKRNL